MPLTIEQMKNTPFAEIIDDIENMIELAGLREQQGDEEETSYIRRILTRAPQLYAFLQSATSRFAYWTDVAANMYNQQHATYKDYRNKRDMLERMASAVKLYYEASSRRITLLDMEHQYEHRRS